MRTNLSRLPASAPKNEGQARPAPDSSVRPFDQPPISFNDLARFAFPRKTDQHLSFLTGYDPRTCRRWRAGHTGPPAEAFSIILGEIMKRFNQR